MNTIEANVDVDTFVRVCWRWNNFSHIFIGIKSWWKRVWCYFVDKQAINKLAWISFKSGGHKRSNSLLLSAAGKNWRCYTEYKKGGISKFVPLSSISRNYSAKIIIIGGGGGGGGVMLYLMNTGWTRKVEQGARTGGPIKSVKTPRQKHSRFASVVFLVSSNIQSHTWQCLCLFVQVLSR